MMKKTKKFDLLILVVCLLLLVSACSKADPIVTDVGSFEYSQEFMPSIDDAVAAEGNTLLVVYLTPASGTDLDLDAAQDYFFSGTKAILANETYDLKCIAYEQVNNAYVRLGLVFEVKDNGYTDSAEQPVVQLVLPSVQK